MQVQSLVMELRFQMQHSVVKINKQILKKIKYTESPLLVKYSFFTHTAAVCYSELPVQSPKQHDLCQEWPSFSPHFYKLSQEVEQDPGAEDKFFRPLLKVSLRLLSGNKTAQQCERKAGQEPSIR